MGINDKDWPKIRQIIVEVHNVNDRLSYIKKMFKNRGYNISIKQEPSLKMLDIYNVFATR